MRSQHVLVSAVLILLGCAIAIHADNGPTYEETLEYINERFYECGMFSVSSCNARTGTCKKYSYELYYSGDSVTITETSLQGKFSHPPEEYTTTYTFKPSLMTEVEWRGPYSEYHEWISKIIVANKRRGDDLYLFVCKDEVAERLFRAFKHLKAITEPKEDPFAPDPEPEPERDSFAPTEDDAQSEARQEGRELVPGETGAATEILVPIGPNWLIVENQPCQVYSAQPPSDPTVTVSWSGDCVGGKAHGEGVQTFSSGHRYEGEFRNGKKHGRGNMILDSNGSRYEGQWRDGWPNGRGVITFANGSLYEGEFRDGKPHGGGTFTNANGRRFTYSRQWREGCFGNPNRPRRGFVCF